MTLLETVLRSDFVPHLPPLLPTSQNADQQARKNLSRAFSAFAIGKLCEISEQDAAKSVVDDFDDFGIDAIFYHAASETLYIVQAKLKASETFSQEEALAFCQGVRKLVAQDFTGFNKHVLDRETELEDAVTTCSNIVLVVAHTGSGISHHAAKAVQDLLNDKTHGEERFASPVTDYDAERAVADLQSAQSYPRVDATIVLRPWAGETEPRQTYFGLIPIAELVKLHIAYDKALYAKNIRTFLGKTTDVNRAIQDTLQKRPEKFNYLNNGVTALCEVIEPKDNKTAGKRLKLTGVSVINGAQTIASSARFVLDNPSHDISAANVMLTLIRADGDGDFGKAVTRARNHQNPVLLANFAALDDEQERLRCELAVLGIHYAYKAEGPDGIHDPSRIRIDEAAHALALLQSDPRFAIWLKKEPGQLLDTQREPYKALFHPKLTALELANAVRLFSYLQGRMVTEANAASGQERLTYKHGPYALGFILAKQVAGTIKGAALIDPAKLPIALSTTFDATRQALWTTTQKRLWARGPLALFRNQSEGLPLLRDAMIERYGLAADPAIAALRAKPTLGQAYPEALFKYLAAKAPQIGNLV